MRPVELVELTSAPPPGVRFFTTLEGHGASGSIKDRLVEPELSRLLAEHGEDLRARGIAELSAGSTARSLAHHCRARQIPFVAFIDAASTRLGRELEGMGASVRMLSGAVAEAYQAYERECAAAGYLPFRQFDDPAKRAHYHGFGQALGAMLPAIDHVVGAVGTGHSLLGTAAAFPQAQVHTAEPDGVTVAGTRNLDEVWFRERDPLFPDRPRLDRVLVDAAAMFEGNEVSSDQGTVIVGDSFRLVLGAAQELARACDVPTSFLLLGAENRLKR